MTGALQQRIRVGSMRAEKLHRRLPGLLLAVAMSLQVTPLESQTPPRVEIFTDARHPVLATGPTGSDRPEVHIYRLDPLHQLELRLSENLSRDPEQARRQVLERFSRIHETDRARLHHGAVGLARAIHYGIDRYPAMVFNGHAVVYGLTDLDTARAHYRRWLKP